LTKAQLEVLFGYNESVGRECPLVWKVDRPRSKAGTPLVFRVDAQGYCKTTFSHAIFGRRPGGALRQNLLAVHRLVALMNSQYQKLPPLMVVDHIDGDRSNNLAGNLRVVTRRQNSNNKRVWGNSQYRRVRWRRGRKKNPWHVELVVNCKHIHVGVFSSEKEAAIAADQYLVDLLGVEGVIRECRQLNFPEMYGIDVTQGQPVIIEEYQPPPPLQMELF
tara:strand:- start:30 stop:686 length:657 start_codon:yes stop_codon:yes gene_type:complete